MSALGREMTRAVQRMAVASGNLSNAETPGYRTQEVHFAEALDGQIGALRPAATNGRHLGPTAGGGMVQEAEGGPARRDGNNVQMAEREVRAGGARELTTDLPVETIDAALQPFGDARVVGTSKSDPNYAPDRSAYLCNYLGYNLATEFAGTPKTTAGFMHISPQTPPDQMHAVLEAVTARQLDWRREQQPHT